MKGDSAQSGFLRRGMCARQAPPWAATDMMLYATTHHGADLASCK